MKKKVNYREFSTKEKFTNLVKKERIKRKWLLILILNIVLMILSAYIPNRLSGIAILFLILIPFILIYGLIGRMFLRDYISYLFLEASKEKYKEKDENKKLIKILKRIIWSSTFGSSSESEKKLLLPTAYYLIPKINRTLNHLIERLEKEEKIKKDPSLFFRNLSEMIYEEESPVKIYNYINKEFPEKKKEKKKIETPKVLKDIILRVVYSAGAVALWYLFSHLIESFSVGYLYAAIILIWSSMLQKK